MIEESGSIILEPWTSEGWSINIRSAVRSAHNVVRTQLNHHHWQGKPGKGQARDPAGYFVWRLVQFHCLAITVRIVMMVMLMIWLPVWQECPRSWWVGQPTIQTSLGPVVQIWSFFYIRMLDISTYVRCFQFETNNCLSIRHLPPTHLPTYIPDICHFFTLTHFENWKFYTQ